MIRVLTRFLRRQIYRVDVRRTAGYLARQEIAQILNEKAKIQPHGLEMHGFKVYSQNDEDGILEEIFSRLGMSRGVFLEVGVENGLECNTRYLLHKDWTGVWIEANSKHVRAIRRKFEELLRRGQLRVLERMVTRENFADIYRQCAFADDPDFFSIDIDGNDIHILSVLPFKPKVICIEYNARFPPGVRWIQRYDPDWRWRGTDYFGASLSSIDEVSRSLGYKLVATNITGVNAFFVRGDLVASHFPAGFDPIDLYNPPRYWLTEDHFSKIGHPADFGAYDVRMN